MMMMMIIEPLRCELVFLFGGAITGLSCFLGGEGIAIAAVLSSWLFDRIR